MRSLLHVVAGGSQAGRSLPQILPALSDATIEIRQGQLHVVMGLPSAGKTLFTTWYAVNSGVPALYFSFDSDDGTVSNRVLANMTGKTFEEVKAQRETPAVVELEDLVYQLQRRLRFDFSGSATMDSIWAEVDAWTVLFGDVPKLIVIDNLMNLVGGAESETTSFHDNMNALHTLARETGSAVIVLHHVNASLLTATGRNRIVADRPAPMGAITGQVSQLPETILSVALDGPRFWIAAVKNRDGIRDVNAEHPICVGVDASTGSFYNSHRDLEIARTRKEWS